MMNILLAQILIVVGMIYIIIKSISDVQDHQRKINRSFTAIGKQKRKQPRWTPHSEKEKETEMKRCEYCGKEIPDEEYETERHGYCNECSDDLATEEEEDVWGI